MSNAGSPLRPAADAGRTPGIDTVIWDIGNVLIPWSPRRLFEKLIADAVELEHFLTRVCPLSWHAEVDGGKTMAQAIAERTALFPEYAALIAAFYGRIDEMFGEPIEGSVALLRRLHAAGWRLLALTNWPAEHFPLARKRWDFLNLFEGVVVSGEEGMVKPDERIYRLLCERHNVAAQRAVFMDDSLANVEGARRAGIHAIHFQSPAQLEEALRKLGVPC